MTTLPQRWDIFCKVIDNFGDAGVSWRLARELVAEHGCAVTLWLDDVAALASIAPEVVATEDTQRARGVTIQRWRDPFPDARAAEVVIDAFGCGIPDGYLTQLAARASPAHYFILEYLSAEAWVDDLHGLPSHHPRLSIERRFWFPGFTARSGGLLRERGLFAARDAFQSNQSAQAAWWAANGIATPSSDAMKVSLFSYPNPALPALLEVLEYADTPVVCIVPEGVDRGALDAWSHGQMPHAGGAPFTRGRLRLHVIPLIAQDEYDKLLWACDINFVRGEDSFVRAQWAARPFVWQLYPQAERTHLVKLGAFIDRYAAGLEPTAAAAVRGLSGAWNGAPDSAPLKAAWLDFAAARPDLRTHGQRWATHLAGLPSLATGLVKAVQVAV